MIREAAALGVPAYSTFGGRTGVVDEYLEASGRLKLIRDRNEIDSKIEIRKRSQSDRPDQRRRSTLNSVVDTIARVLEA